MTRAVTDKMLELRTRDLQQSGFREDEARKMATDLVATAADLHARALIATQHTVTYYPRMEWDLEATRKLNPGVDIQPHPDGGFTATSPELAVAGPTPARYKDVYEFPEHLRVGGSLFNEGNPADACCDGEEGPTQGSDEEYRPAGQDWLDKLRVISAVVDEQAPFGSDLADFKRRLRLVLDA